jgi:hypothetical protein
MNTDSSKSANIPHTVHIMEATQQSPMHVHDVAGESAIYYSRHKQRSATLPLLENITASHVITYITSSVQ